MARTREPRTPRITRADAQKPISDIAPEEGRVVAGRLDSRPAVQTADGDTRARPSEDDIRRRAYGRYEERGRADGFADDDWYVAERELRTRE
jgi:hypothetical protein